MNQSYKISWCEKKTTTTGKAYIKATLEGVEGQVSIWSDFPNFANIMPGSSIVGDLKKNDKGYLTLYPPKANNGGASRGSQAKSTWTPEKSKEVQEIKDLSYKISGTQRDAVLCALAEFNGGRGYTYGKTLGENILGWRKWLWENYDAKDSDFDPFPSKSKVVSTGDDISQDDINAEFNACGN